MQKNDAALLETAIPEEAIRLRILANSDSPQDQAIKMLVRDRVVEQMNSWASEANTIEEARLVVNAHLSELNDIVAAVLNENGQAYQYNLMLANVDFPTKAYGGLVYPGGEYEALLITLGKAEGRNWWCVLFPPLCFTDTVSGEATAITKTVVEDEQELDEKKQAEPEHNEVEVKFFLADAWKWVTSLFS